MAESVMSYMQLPQWLARFNRHVTNPIQRMWAGWAPTMGILEHVGRRSGKPYRTPLTVFSASLDGQDAVVVLLTYGPDRDWLKNVTAAGSATMRRYGRSFLVTDPTVMSKADAARSVTGMLRPLFPLLPFESAVLFLRG